MSEGHTEYWGIRETELITVVVCSRCAAPYEISPYVHLILGDTFTVHFPCCPDGGDQFIEWQIEAPPERVRSAFSLLTTEGVDDDR